MKTHLSGIATIATTAALIALSHPVLGADREPRANAAEPKKSTAAGGIQVNDRSIPEQQLQLLLAARQAAGAPAGPALTNAVREQLIGRELFAQEARKAKLDNSPEFGTKARMAMEELLAAEYQSHYIAQHPVTEAQLQAAYATFKQRAGAIEYRLRQVFVPTEETAKQVVARLAGGERFDSLAASLSKDESSRERGGDLGWLKPFALQAHVIGAVTALKKGEFTRTPIKGPNGWHVILLEDTRPYTPPTFEQLAPQLKRELTHQALETHLAELRKKATVQ
jgi:peptidyl-prolyl cis-trans isomerase C